MQARLCAQHTYGVREEGWSLHPQQYRHADWKHVQIHHARPAAASYHAHKSENGEKNAHA